MVTFVDLAIGVVTSVVSAFIIKYINDHSVSFSTLIRKLVTAAKNIAYWILQKITRE